MGWVEGQYTLCTQRKSPYGFDESRVIYLPRVVQTGRQVDCYCPSIVLSSLVETDYSRQKPTSVSKKDIFMEMVSHFITVEI